MAQIEGERLKRLRMRSWRRGMKEMDLILGPFSDARLPLLAEADLAQYEALLVENDPEIYGWITGNTPPPDRYARLLAEISDFARGRLASQAGHAG